MRKVERQPPVPVQYLYPIGLDCTLSYRKKKIAVGKGTQYKRYYYLGKVLVAQMTLYYKEEHSAGKACVHMQSVIIPGGKWFKSREAAEQFIVSELMSGPKETGAIIL